MELLVLGYRIAIVYIAGCVSLLCGGGGYKFHDKDEMEPVAGARVLYNPMVELRIRKLPYIRDALFASLFCTPLYVYPLVKDLNNSWYMVLAYALGYVCFRVFSLFALFGQRRWGEMIDMNDGDDYITLAVRLTQFVIPLMGVALLINASVESAAVAICATALYAFSGAAAYILVRKWLWLKTLTNYPTPIAEMTNGVLQGLVLTVMIYVLAN